MIKLIQHIEMAQGHGVYYLSQLQHKHETAVRTSVSLATAARPTRWVSPPDIQNTLNSLYRWQSSCNVTRVRKSVGRCSAKRPFMYLFVLMSRGRKDLTCIQRTGETRQSTRIKQMDRDGATSHHFHRQMTHFNINGSITYDINVRENVTSSDLNEHHSWIFQSSLLKNAIDAFWTVHQPRNDTPKAHRRYEMAGRLQMNSGCSAAR